MFLINLVYFVVKSIFYIKISCTPEVWISPCIFFSSYKIEECDILLFKLRRNRFISNLINNIDTIRLKVIIQIQTLITMNFSDACHFVYKCKRRRNRPISNLTGNFDTVKLNMIVEIQTRIIVFIFFGLR
jgi:hypothetical protein